MRRPVALRLCSGAPTPPAGRRLDDQALTAYLAELHDQGRQAALFQSMDPAGRRLTARTLDRRVVLAMIERRAAAAGLPPSTCCHTFRTTGITAYLSNGGTPPARPADRGTPSPKTTKLYDRTADTVTVDEIERIVDPERGRRRRCGQAAERSGARGDRHDRHGQPGRAPGQSSPLGHALQLHVDPAGRRLTGRVLERRVVLAMIKRRAAAAGLPPSTCCHTFRATGITAYLSNGGTLEHAQQIAGHASPKTTKLHDRTADTVTADEDRAHRDLSVDVPRPKGMGGDTTTAAGRLVFRIFAALAEFERELIRERTVAGLKGRAGPRTRRARGGSRCRKPRVGLARRSPPPEPECS